MTRDRLAEIGKALVAARELQNVTVSNLAELTDDELGALVRNLRAITFSVRESERRVLRTIAVRHTGDDSFDIEALLAPFREPT